MTCKRCNNELPENSRFCLACGALQPMICPHCKAESRPGSRTCSGCGKKLPVSADSAVKFYKRKKTPSEIAAMVLLLLGSAFVVTAAVMFLVGTVSDVSVPETQEQQMNISLELPPVTVEDPIPRKETTAEETFSETTDDVPEEVTEQTTEEVTEEPAEETTEETTEQTTEETTEEAEEQTQNTSKEWFFPDSNERLLTEADIAGLSKAELKIARNEIFARRGRRFSNPDLQRWFDSCSWYNGTIAPGDFDDNMLNETEAANASFLLAAEQ